MTISDKLHSDAAMTRGIIINEVAHLEKMIDAFLSMYFVQVGKQTTFYLVFLSQMQLTKKVNIFKDTVSSYKNDFVKNNPTYSVDLGKIIEQRNLLAHEIIDLSKGGFLKYSKGYVQFDNFKKKRKVTAFGKTDVKNLIALIQKYTIAVTELLSK